MVGVGMIHRVFSEYLRSVAGHINDGQISEGSGDDSDRWCRGT